MLFYLNSAAGVTYIFRLPLNAYNLVVISAI